MGPLEAAYTTYPLSQLRVGGSDGIQKDMTV